MIVVTGAFIRGSHGILYTLFTDVNAIFFQTQLQRALCNDHLKNPFVALELAIFI